MPKLKPEIQLLALRELIRLFIDNQSLYSQFKISGTERRVFAVFVTKQRRKPQTLEYAVD